MNYRLLAVFGGFLFASFARGTPIQLGDRRADDIRYAGAADGKTFFVVSNGTLLNWQEAGQGCHQMNMRLAEFTSPAQVNAVKSSFDSGLIPNTFYWIGGRDAFLPRQFSWNSTDIDVSVAQLDLGGFSIENPNTCLFYVPLYHRVNYVACADRNTNYRICEIST